MTLLFRAIVKVDVLILKVLTLGKSKSGETISAAAWSLELDGKLQGRIFRPTIDFLLAWMEDNHCERAYNKELRNYINSNWTTS